LLDVNKQNIKHYVISLK